MRIPTICLLVWHIEESLQFAMHFEDECMILSCDDMNEVNVGTLAVSSYHQLKKFFPKDDQPNYLDHDFPIPGDKFIPSGYLILTDHSGGDSKHVSDHCKTFDVSEHELCDDSDKEDYEAKSSDNSTPQSSEST